TGHSGQQPGKFAGAIDVHRLSAKEAGGAPPIRVVGYPKRRAPQHSEVVEAAAGGEFDTGPPKRPAQWGKDVRRGFADVRQGPEPAGLAAASDRIGPWDRRAGVHGPPGRID